MYDGYATVYELPLPFYIFNLPIARKYFLYSLLKI